MGCASRGVRYCPCDLSDDWEVEGWRVMAGGRAPGGRGPRRVRGVRVERAAAPEVEVEPKLLLMIDFVRVSFPA